MSGATVPTLRNNFAWTFAGNVLYGACQWGMLSALAKLGSAAIVGEFTLGLAISAPIFMFTMLQLRYVQATDVHSESVFADYFTLRLVTSLVGMLMVIALLPFAATSGEVRLVIFLVSVSKFIESLSEVTAGLLQREEQLKRVAISLIIRGSCSLLVFSVTFVFFRNVALSVFALSCVWLAVFLLYDMRNVRLIIGRIGAVLRFDWSKLWRLVKLGLPLGWVATFTILIVNVPRYFLQHYRGLAEQGIYASVAYLIVAVNMVVTALVQSVTTRMAVLFAERQLKRFKALLFRLSMLGVLISVFGVPMTIWAGRPILIHIYRPEYAAYTNLLVILVCSSGFATIVAFVYGGLTAARKFQAQVPLYAFGLVTCVASSAFLVPRFGVVGGGVAFLLSQIALVGGGLLKMWQVLHSQPIPSRTPPALLDPLD